MEQEIRTDTDLLKRVFSCSGQLKKIIVRAVANKRQPLSVIADNIKEDEKDIARYLSKTIRHEEYNYVIGKKLCELLNIRVFSEDIGNRVMIDYVDER